MKFKTYTGITWSDLELTGLLEDEDSRVYFEKFKKHLGLHPFHLTNLNAALNEILSSNLNSYDTELKGFLLAYKNPKLLTPLGEILYDTCFIHVDIEADFYVFRPDVGCSLKGIVNKKGLDHIGVLVHKAFNVSIPKPDNDEDWPGDDLEIGQEVRFAITRLDITSKLPFIRGALNSNDYLQGCRIMEKKHNKRASFNNNSIVSSTSEVSSERTNRQIFFATDSEHSSNEDVPQVEKEISKQKRPKKKYEQEELIEHHEKKKEDKKRTKKAKGVKESKSKLITTESVEEQYVNNVSMNGEFEADMEPEEAITSKKHARKKSRDHSSQSSIDEHDNEKSKKYSQKKTLKRLSHIESRDEISDVKLKQCASNSDSEQAVEETMSKGKVKSKKGSNKLPHLESNDKISNIKLEQSMANSDSEQGLEETVFESKTKSKKTTKRQHIDEGDNFVDDLDFFTADKYIKHSSKKDAKKAKMADTESKQVNIKTENLNELYIDEVNNVKESPNKKKHKIRKDSMKLETSESEVDKRNIEKTSVKRRSKKLNMSESEFTIGNVKIKTEKMTSGSENTQDEDHEETNKLSQKNCNLNASTCSSNYDVEEDNENNIVKKKRKKHSKKSLIDPSEIKIEPGFEDVIVKLEEPDDDNDDATENIRQKSNTKDPSKTTSPKKKHKVEMDNDITNDETDKKNNVTHLKKNKVTDKEIKTYDVKIKTEKSIRNDALDEDMSDADERPNEKVKNHSKGSPNKHLNKSRKSESDVDFSNVKIKIEKSVNS